VATQAGGGTDQGLLGVQARAFVVLAYCGAGVGGWMPREAMARALYEGPIDQELCGVFGLRDQMVACGATRPLGSGGQVVRGFGRRLGRSAGDC
jgi:hypothetical protein